MLQQGIKIIPSYFSFIAVKITVATIVFGGNLWLRQQNVGRQSVFVATNQKIEVKRVA